MSVKFASEDDAQAIVEFALVLPVLLLAAFAIVVVTEIGIARLALQHATAEGARTGALTNDDDAIRATVAAAVVPLLPDSVTTEVEPPGYEPPRNADPRGSLITVRVSYEIAAPLGIIGLNHFTVRAAAVRRIEWTP